MNPFLPPLDLTLTKHSLAPAHIKAHLPHPNVKCYLEAMGDHNDGDYQSTLFQTTFIRTEANDTKVD